MKDLNLDLDRKLDDAREQEVAYLRRMNELEIENKKYQLDLEDARSKVD